MPWWGWIVVGAALLGSELLLVDADFYLVLLGSAAIVVGLADVAGLGGPIWAEWLAFAALSVVAMVFFRERIYRRLRASARAVPDGMLGEIAVVKEGLAPGSVGRAELRGTVWTARNLGSERIEAGERARVESAEGLTLGLRRVDPSRS